MTGFDADQLAPLIFTILRKMDCEAAATPAGKRRAGLYAYHAYCRCSSREKSWYRALARHLTEAGHSSDADVPLPGQEHKKGKKKECDMVVTLPTDRRLWVEVKPAWRTWFSEEGIIQGNNPAYRSYLFGSQTRTHSAAQDVDKLESFVAGTSDYMGLLLIGFDDSRGAIVSDVHQLFAEKGLAARGWKTCGPAIWPDPNTEECQIYCWFWWRRG